MANLGSRRRKPLRRRQMLRTRKEFARSIAILKLAPLDLEDVTRKLDRRLGPDRFTPGAKIVTVPTTIGQKRSQWER